jgi:hypothetical protein
MTWLVLAIAALVAFLIADIWQRRKSRTKVFMLKIGETGTIRSPEGAIIEIKRIA